MCERLQGEGVFIGGGGIREVVRGLYFRIASFAQGDHECGSCGNGINGVTPGEVGEQFGASVPRRGVAASAARFGCCRVSGGNEVMVGGLCLSPFLSVFGNRILDCNVDGAPSTTDILSTRGRTVRVASSYPCEEAFRSSEN